MRNINKVILIGNIARAPDIKTTASGQKMATFVMATNRTWYDPNGSKQSQAEFHNILAWGRVADICERFLQKSTLVYVEGYLKTRSWENESGVRLYRTEIIIQDVLVLDKGIRCEENFSGKAPHAPLEKPSSVSPESEASSIFESDTKPASEIEKSFQEKLGQEEHIADTKIVPDSPETTDSISLDAPLFEEEQK